MTTTPIGGCATRCTDRDALFTSVERTYREGLELIQRKNQDYGADADPFRNFRMVGLLGLSVEQGILVRVLDKIARINNLLSHDPAVTDESMADTITDAINYLAILKAFRDRY